ncbi:MAG: sorbosone dehydrogenase family protein, partial [Rubripirellula sp.]
MQRRTSRVVPLFLAWVTASLMVPWMSSGQDSIPPRVAPWTVSRIKGSPDPPLPYKATRVFAKVDLDQPTEVRWVPSAQKWLSTQRGSKLVTFDNSMNATAEPFLDLSEALGQPVLNVHGIVFHPDQKNQPWCFVTFITARKDPEGVRLGRLRVIDPTVPTLDASSLEVLASWNSGGHVGMSMQFGPDGMLYVSIGDGQRPYPPDADNTGQDLSDLQSSILRIDVNDPTPGRPYRIPPDNPFVGQDNVREEIWAFGFRNPWKIAFDPISGDLLAADVGWEAHEMIHRVKKGRNHGWSIKEGSQTVKQDLQPKIPITPPLF